MRRVRHGDVPGEAEAKVRRLTVFFSFFNSSRQVSGVHGFGYFEYTRSYPKP